MLTRLYLFALGLFLITVTSCEPPSTPRTEHPRAAAVRSLMKSLESERAFSGAIWISEHGKTVYASGHGFADIENGVPFTLTTTADTGSLTKNIVATALFQIQEEGSLSIEDPVANYIDSFPYPSVRIVHLLSHSSGIPDHGYFEALPDFEVEWTNSFFLDALRTHRPPLEFEPGTQVRYSTLGYDLLASVIEGATGSGFFEALDRLIFEPLDMNEVFLRPRYFSDWPHTRTRGYRNDDGTWLAHDSEDDEQIYGGANLFFSTEDLHLWNLSALDERLLSEGSLAEASPRYRLRSGEESSLNLLCEYVSADHSKAWFTGDWKGFYTMAFRDRAAQRSIVYVTNNTLPMWLRAELVLRISEILDGGAVDALAPERVSLSDFSLLLSSGEFDVEGLGQMVVRSGEQWSLTLGGKIFRLYPVSDRDLYFPERDAWLSFSDPSDAPSPRLHWNTAAGRSIGSPASPRR